jgi:AraC-like DNA-binding protein
MTDQRIKYLPESEQDVLWGLTVSTVGFQRIGEREAYPPQNHPSRYLFSTEKGRILNEYQLVYITRGEGSFVSGSHRTTSLKAGNVLLLFPEEWHNYSPLKKTGWDEYWIGFKGFNMDNRQEVGFFNKQKPVFNVGINDEIVYLYKQAIEVAKEQKTGFQQMLAGIVNHLLGLIYSQDRHLSFEELNVITKIDKAKVIMREHFQSGINPEEVAGQVCMSYSWFRRIFRQYTGFSPHQYILELKIQKSKELLTNTGLTVKEVAYQVNFDNPDHFCTTFRKKTGTTPMNYRNFTQGNIPIVNPPE